MTLLVLTALAIAMILTIWFDTEALVEYIRVFHLQKVLGLQEFFKMRGEDQSFKLLDYLQTYHDSFWTRLLSCDICLSSWLALASTSALICTIGFPSWIIATLFLPASAFLGLFFCRLLGRLVVHG